MSEREQRHRCQVCGLMYAARDLFDCKPPGMKVTCRACMECDQQQPLEPSGETPALNLITALTLARDTGAKVRPVCWRTGTEPEPEWLAWIGWKDGDYWLGNNIGLKADVGLSIEDELLGPWEVVP